MKLLKIILLIFLFSSSHYKIFSQCDIPIVFNCDVVQSDILLSTPTNLDLIFDSFSEYQGGITLNGSSIIKLKLVDNPALTCKWKLTMYAINNALPASNDWERTATFGSGSGLNPQCDILQVKVSNACSNATNNGIWQTFPLVSPSSLDIINSVALTPAGPCAATQTNGAGSYLTNYNEFSFTLDYRIVPGLTFMPGRYELKVKFCLTEQ
jgi:hypothetical protein